MSTRHQATLVGSVTNPSILLDYPYTAKLPEGHKREGLTINEWVKSAPGRKFDRSTKRWHLTATGGKPFERILAAAGFDLRIDDDAFPDLLDTTELLTPIIRQHPHRSGVAQIRPRFLGYEPVATVFPAAVWDKKRQLFEVPLAEIVDDEGDLVVDWEVIDEDTVRTSALRSRLANPAHADKSVRAAAARAAFDTGIDLTEDRQKVIDRLAETVGEIPDWFGLDLRPYQRIGALAAVAGRRLIADSPGVGKTRTALGAASLSNPQRVLIVSPPVAIIHWGIETSESGLVTHTPVYGHDGTPKTFAPHIRLVLSGKDEPDLPDRGVVIVSDSLLASRDALTNNIISWAPDVVIVDEIHRYRTWTSSRTSTMRELAASLPDVPVYGITGTPMYSNPLNLAGPLAITGQLIPVFGGYTLLANDYCWQDSFGKWNPKRSKLAGLKRRLDSHVWVMRSKLDIMPDLPPKTRVGEYVNVSLSGYRSAHKEVIERATEWLETFVEKERRMPSETEISDKATSSIGLMSPLRLAAGRAKIPSVVERIIQHLEANTENGQLTGDPLLVWVHHKDVVTEMLAALDKLPPKTRALVETITGADSVTERGRKAYAFQEGSYGVLVCSIGAAGVGITLTRAWQQIFVETGYNPTDQTQAEDRLNRSGQTQAVLCEYLLAAGTLDGRIFKILQDKSRIIDSVVGANDKFQIAEIEREDLGLSPSELVTELIEVAIAKFKKTPRGKKLAASDIQDLAA